MSPNNLFTELERSRDLLESCPKPLIPDISLEIRKSLAAVLGTEESIDHLIRVQRLHKPIADEIAPWEDDPELAEWFNELDLEAEQAEKQREIQHEQALERLREAQKRYDDFVSGRREEPVQAQNTVRKQKLGSKDDLSTTTTTRTALQRRPSFMADTSQTNIEIHEPVSEPLKLPITSTPHVGMRSTKMEGAMGSAHDLFRQVQEEIPRIRSRASSVHFDDEIRDDTFEIADAKNKENADPFSEHRGRKSNLKRNNTVLIKKNNETILKPSANDMTCVIETAATEHVVPKIAPRSRPVIAPRTLREPLLTAGSKLPGKMVLPSKIQTGPGEKSGRTINRRPLLPSKDSSVPKPSISSGISRPSKSVQSTRLPARK